MNSQQVVKTLSQATRLAFDIEIVDSETLSCVAFADSPHRAFVFPAARREEIRLLLQTAIPKVAQNGQFDVYFLRTRCDLEVANYVDDTIVAWHACYPELAGAAQDKRGGSKRTRKSLAFLASLYTKDAWWKDYDFATPEEEYELCGRDACITYEVMEALEALMARLDVRAIYEHQMQLIEPCIVMQERGLNVEEEIRLARLENLESRIVDANAELLPFVRSRFLESKDKVRRRNLFWQKRTCHCCRGGKNKTPACWSCAGFDHSPGTRELRARREAGGTLGPCKVCNGKGKWEEFDFNPNSPEQIKILLYDVLKLPKRFKDGKVTTDEEALKGLLAKCQSEP